LNSSPDRARTLPPCQRRSPRQVLRGSPCPAGPPQQPSDPIPGPDATTGGAAAGASAGAGHGRGSLECSSTGSPSSTPPPAPGAGSVVGKLRPAANRSPGSCCSVVVMAHSVVATHARRQIRENQGRRRCRPRWRPGRRRPGPAARRGSAPGGRAGGCSTRQRGVAALVHPPDAGVTLS